MVSSRRFLLREGTAAAHRALEDIVGPLDSEPGYRRYVRGLFLGRAPVETGFSAIEWPEFFGDWRPQAIAGLLQADARDLGEVVGEAGPPYEPAGGVSGLLGAIYVLEGSALGARLLVKRAAAMGFSADFGARHLAAQTGTTASWTRFLSILDAADRFDDDLCVAAANDLFGAMGRAMRG